MTNMSTEGDPGSRAVVRDRKIFFAGQVVLKTHLPKR